MVKGVQVSGKKVTALRQARFLSQEKLARAAGMSRENLRRIERAQKTGIHTDNFVGMAAAFGVSPEELLEKVKPDQVDWDDLVDTSGVRITMARTARDMSEAEFAKAIGMKTVDVLGFAKFPTGRVPRHIFNKIAEVLRMPADYLQAKPDEMKNSGTEFWILPLDDHLRRQLEKYAKQEGMELGFFAAKVIGEGIDEHKKEEALKIETAGAKSPGRPAKKAAKPRQTGT